MKRNTLLEVVEKHYDLPRATTVHIQLAAGATGYAAVELYRGLTTDSPLAAWGTTNPESARHHGAFCFLVAKPNGRNKDGGWDYEGYTLAHRWMNDVPSKLAVTSDGDRLVRLFNLSNLTLLGEMLLDLPGYTPR